MSKQNRQTRRLPLQAKPKQRRVRTKRELMPLMNSPAMTSYARNAVRPETDVVLAFQVNKIALNAGASTCSIRYTPNGAYDVDPTLGSTATPGFTEWMALYTYYRVVKVSYELDIANNEAIPVRAYVGFTVTDPGTTGSTYMPGNPLYKSKLLAGKGGIDVHRFRDTKTVSTVIGSKGVEMEDNYRGTSASNPTDLIYLEAAGNTVSGAFLAAGLTVSGNVRMFIRFYDPKILFA